MQSMSVPVIILLLSLIRPVCLGTCPTVTAHIHPHMSKTSLVVGNRWGINELYL